MSRSSKSVVTFLRQLWPVSGVYLNMVGCGMVFAFPSSLLPALRNPNSSIQADADTTTWISSCIGVAGAPSLFFSSFIMTYWGRKITQIAVNIPTLIGWLFIYFANNVPMLIIGRALNGLTTSSSIVIGSIVVGEYSSPKYRGMFLNLRTTSVALGCMIGHITSNYLTWRTIALISTTPHLISLVINITSPETPTWLASRKQIDKCIDSFVWLRGNDDTSRIELRNMIQAQENNPKSENKTILNATIDFFMKFTKKNFVIPIIIITFAGALVELSGRHYFPAYALDIINGIIGSEFQSFYYTLGLDLIITISLFFSSVLVTLFNRRTLLFGTGFFALIILSILCIYLFLVSKEIVSKDYPIIPVGLLVIYFVLVNLGCTTISCGLLGEIFPLEHKGAGSAISGVILALCINATLQAIPPLLANLGVHGTFAVVSIGIAISLLGLFFLLPETKNKTLQEIDEFFNNDKGNNQDSATVKMIEKI